jgi:hypothetical protein
MIITREAPDDRGASCLRVEALTVASA